jgi:hypothetical protein
VQDAAKRGRQVQKRHGPATPRLRQFQRQQELKAVYSKGIETGYIHGKIAALFAEGKRFAQQSFGRQPVSGGRGAEQMHCRAAVLDRCICHDRVGFQMETPLGRRLTENPKPTSAVAQKCGNPSAFGSEFRFDTPLCC